jgi:TatD DNase family protein
MNKLIDTHFHLDFYKNHSQIYSQINKLEQYTLCVTNSPGVFLSCLKLYPETKYVKFALGFHPQDISTNKLSIRDFKQCLNRANYIGEIGVDLSAKYANSEKIQLANFTAIVELAKQHNKLTSVHVRNAEDKIVEIMDRIRPQKCIIHWFNGNEEQLNALVELGCYFSLNTHMLSSQSQVDRIKSIPIDRILIESDGPFTKVKKKLYSPALLKDAYSIIESLLEVKDLKDIVYNNFRYLLLR